MQALLQKLQGYKTYIVIVVGALFNIGIIANWWTAESQLWEFINMIFVYLGIGGIRSGLKTEANKIIEQK